MESSQSNEANEITKIKLCVTPDDLRTNDLNGSELITLSGVYNQHFREYVKIDDMLQLEQKGFIEGPEFQRKLSKKGLALMRKLTETNHNIKFKVAKLPKANEIAMDLEFIEEYRKLFKNTKVGAMGSPMGVKAKMKRFMDNNPNATKEIILEATRRYLDSLNSYQYLQQADYFIYKRDQNGDESSRLEIYVEEVIANPSGTFDDDWTTRVV